MPLDPMLLARWGVDNIISTTEKNTPCSLSWPCTFYTYRHSPSEYLKATPSLFSSKINFQHDLVYIANTVQIKESHKALSFAPPTQILPTHIHTDCVIRYSLQGTGCASFLNRLTAARSFRKTGPHQQETHWTKKLTERPSKSQPESDTGREKLKNLGFTHLVSAEVQLSYQQLIPHLPDPLSWDSALSRSA